MKSIGYLYYWKFLLLGFLLSLFLQSHASLASVENAVSLSINKAVDLALQKNKTYDNVKKSIREAELNYSVTRKERLPKVSTSYSYLRFNEDLVMTTTNPLDNTLLQIPLLKKDNYTWLTSLSMPVYSGGTQELSEDINKLGIDVAKLRLLQAKNELVMNIKYYYYNVLKNKKFAEFLDQNLKSLREHERLTEQFHQQGLVAKNSVLEAKVEISNGEQELSTAQENAEISKSSLKVAIGMDISQDIILEDILEKKKFDLSMEDCLKFAEKNNPELVAFTFLKQQAEKGVELEKAHYNPTLSLTASYIKYGDRPNLAGYEGFPNNILSAMLNINWLILDWGQKSEESRIKKVQLEQIINNEKTAKDNISLKIKEAYARMATAEKNIETAELAVLYAKENVRITKLRYKEQVAQSSEVIDAVTALKKSEYNYYTALYNYNVAAAVLEHAMGKDTEKIIKTQE